MAATFTVAPPEPFNFKCPSEWTKWIRRFERFKSASGLEEKSEERQVNALLYTMGETADDIFQWFGLSDDDKKVYKTVKERFDSHFVKRKNVIYERAMFNRRKQEDGETVDTFITSLYSLSEHCNYGALREEMIRDRLVVGIRDSAVSLKLQMNKKLTLDEAVKLVREAETIKKQQPLLRSELQKESINSSAVASVRKGRQDRGQKPKTGQGLKQTSSRQACTRCGRSPPHDRQHCPAKDAICHKCSKKGHYKAMCRSTAKVGDVRQDEPDYTEAFLGAVGTDRDNPWVVKPPGDEQINRIPHRHRSGSECDYRWSAQEAWQSTPHSS